MEIVNLPTGKVAGPEADCVRIQELPGGRFTLSGAVLLTCGDTDAAESVGLIGGEPYETYDAAEAAGLAWAAEHCVETIFVSRSDGTQLLPDPD
jgi:hypothetical protein